IAQILIPPSPFSGVVEFDGFLGEGAGEGVAGGAVGDDVVERSQRADEFELIEVELAAVDEQEISTASLEHDPLDPDAVGVRVGRALDGQSAGADEGLVHGVLSNELQRRGSVDAAFAGDVVARAEDDADVVRGAELGGPRDAVGYHRDLDPARRQGAGEVRGGGAAVDQDRVAGVDQLGGVATDLLPLGGPAASPFRYLRFMGQRQRRRTAVGAMQQAATAELVEIAAGGFGGDVECIGEGVDAHRSLCLCQLNDALLSFLAGQACRGHGAFAVWSRTHGLWPSRRAAALEVFPDAVIASYMRMRRSGEHASAARSRNV